VITTRQAALSRATTCRASIPMPHRTTGWNSILRAFSVFFPDPSHLVCVCIRSLQSRISKRNEPCPLSMIIRVPIRPRPRSESRFAHLRFMCRHTNWGVSQGVSRAVHHNERMALPAPNDRGRQEGCQSQLVEIYGKLSKGNVCCMVCVFSSSPTTPTLSKHGYLRGS
jgi:hypothetical protein